MSVKRSLLGYLKQQLSGLLEAAAASGENFKLVLVVIVAILLLALLVLVPQSVQPSIDWFMY
jgi:hypothetical protein